MPAVEPAKKNMTSLNIHTPTQDPSARWPVAVFVFTRPDPTAALLETLKGSEGAPRIHLFVFADGPRHAEDTRQTEATRQVVRDALANHPFAEVTLVEAHSNQGLAASVIAGVSRILDQYPSAIVLEDDLEISPATIAYLAAALERYESDPRVFSVTAYSYPEKVLRAADLPSGQDNFFLHRPCSWAWGTWRQPWQETQWEGAIYDDFLATPRLQADFKKACGHDVERMLRKQLAGKINSWAIRFTYAAFLNGGLVSYPNKSFVSNIGSRGDGTHRGNNAEWIEHETLCQSFDPSRFGEPALSESQARQFNRFTRRRFLFRRLKGEARRLLRQMASS